MSSSRALLGNGPRGGRALRFRRALLALGIAALASAGRPAAAQSCPGGISNVTVTQYAPFSVSLTWDTPAGVNCDGPCYRVTGFATPGYCTLPDTAAQPDIDVIVDSAAFTTGLRQANVVYWFFIAVNFDQTIRSCQPLPWDTFQPPAVPNLSGASMAPGTATLNFSYPDGSAKTLTLLRATSSGGVFAPVATLSYCPPGRFGRFTDYGPGGSAATGGRLLPGSYDYKLQAANFGSADSAKPPGVAITESNPVTVVVPGSCPNPPAPQDLSVNPQGVAAGQSYVLSWSPVASAAGYQVWKSVNGAPYALAGTTATPSFTGVAKQSETGGQLSFLVRAKADCGEVSPDSNIVTIVVGCGVASAPQFTSPPVTVQARETLFLSWSATLPAGQGQYRLRIARGAGGLETDLAVVPASETSFVYTATDDDAANQPLIFRVQAESQCGSAGDSPFSEPLTVTVVRRCSDPPPAPASARIENSDGGQVTGIAFLDLSWEPVNPAPSSYRWMLNGGAVTEVPGTQTRVERVPPVGTGDNPTDPIRLSVEAVNRCGNSPPATAEESPLAPVADFTWTVSGNEVTFTDISGPQAASWLWLFGDSTEPSAVQAPPAHSYGAAGLYTVWLFASNGAGSSAVSHLVTVGSPSAAATPESATRPFDASDPERQRLQPVQLTVPGRTWLRVTSKEPAETIVFLRLLAPDGALVEERRLSIPAAAEAVFDLAAYGHAGTFSVELASMQKFSAAVEEAGEGGIFLSPRRGSPRTEDFRE